MKLRCSAKIGDTVEREAIRENLIRRFAVSYGDHMDTKTLYATYIGENMVVVDAFIQTFGKYPEHSIELTNT